MLLALSVSAGAVVFAAFLFAALFRFIDPVIVRDDYRACSGDWHEAVLNDCHLGLLKIPQQPVNTYSNLAYLAAGLLPAILADTPASYMFAFAMTYLCVGSSLYHALSTKWAGMLDVTAIYVVFAALAVYALAVFFDFADWLTTLLMFVISGAVAYVLTPRYHTRMRLRIAIFLGLAYLFALLQMGLHTGWALWPYLLGSFLLFALAFLVWNMDKARTFPLKHWGHGLWHFFTAAAAGLLFYTLFASSL